MDAIPMGLRAEAPNPSPGFDRERLLEKQIISALGV
jgi:hypothetical protein